jgi:hypothetical protein
MLKGWQDNFLHLPSVVTPPATCGEQPLHVQLAGQVQVVFVT